MLSIRLVRAGKRHHSTFRVVVIDHKKAADAAYVELLGHYDPHKETDQFVVDGERAKYWIENGAQTTTTVASFLRKMDLGIEIPIRKKKSSKAKIEEKEEGADAPAADAKPAEAPAKEVEEDAKPEEKSEEAPKKEESKDEPKEEKKEEEVQEEKKDEPKEDDKKTEDKPAE